MSYLKVYICVATSDPAVLRSLIVSARVVLTLGVHVVRLGFSGIVLIMNGFDLFLNTSALAAFDVTAETASRANRD